MSNLLNCYINRPPISHETKNDTSVREEMSKETRRKITAASIAGSAAGILA